MSSNAGTVQDEDGGYPDWLELYNPSSVQINLVGFGLSDSADEPYKWTFTHYILEPAQHLIVFASGKNRAKTAAYWETVITNGDEWRYFIGATEPPEGWNTPGFDDTEWKTGPSGFGYGDWDDRTVIAKTVSLYIRKSFIVSDVSVVSRCLLHIDYDDGFVAYINGREVARAGIGTAGTPPAHNQTAENHEARMYSGGSPETFEISDIQSLLVQGENIIAIQGHNTDINSSDFHLIPFLTLGLTIQPENPAVVPDKIQQLFPTTSYFHTNFKLKSEGETLILTEPFGTVCDSVKFGEIPTDVSWGREPDGASAWMFFDEPTPGEPNITEGYTGIADSVTFSLPGGFYNNPIAVELSTGEPDAVVLYTLDGSEPDPINNSENTFLYSSTAPIEIVQETIPPGQTPVAITTGVKPKPPISYIRTNSEESIDYFRWEPPKGEIFKATVIRARVYKDGFLSGKITTHTYFVDENMGNGRYTFPVISIATDNGNLFDYERGIFVPGKTYDENPFKIDYTEHYWRSGNYFNDTYQNEQAGIVINGKDWERPLHIEFYKPDGALGFSVEASVEIFGAGSRSLPQKSLKIGTRKGNTINYPLLPDRPLYSFKTFLLRNGGQTFMNDHFHDAMIQSLIENTTVETQGYCPAIVFINGEYWGIQNIRQSLDKYYPETNYNVNPDDVDLFGGRPSAVLAGDRRHYDAMINFMTENNMSLDENFEHVTTMMDIDNFIDFWSTEIYINSQDLFANIKCWRKRSEYDPEAPYGHDGRWRWMIFDMDYTFYDVSSSAMLGHIIDSIPMKYLLKNQRFKHQFINRFADNLNTSFKSSRVVDVIDSYQAHLLPEIEEHIARWNRYPARDVSTWKNNVLSLRNFAYARPQSARKHFVD